MSVCMCLCVRLLCLLDGNQQPNGYVRVCGVKKIRKNCYWPEQPLCAVCYKTRLTSRGQFDQPFKLRGGAMLAHKCYASA